MAKRKQIGKRKRFEIFKRDKFTCQYCGAKPPAAILVIDHVVPVSGNGSNEEINLVAACQPCNAGKSNIPLDQTPQPIAEIAKEKRERLEQMQAYNEYLKEIQAVEDDAFYEVSDYIMRRQGDNPNRYQISNHWESAVRKFMKWLPPQDIIDSYDIMECNMKNILAYKSFRYFCTVCWNKIRQISGRLEA